MQQLHAVLQSCSGAVVQSCCPAVVQSCSGGVRARVQLNALLHDHVGARPGLSCTPLKRRDKASPRSNLAGVTTGMGAVCRVLALAGPLSTLQIINGFSRGPTQQLAVFTAAATPHVDTLCIISGRVRGSVLRTARAALLCARALAMAVFPGGLAGWGCPHNEPEPRVSTRLKGLLQHRMQCRLLKCVWGAAGNAAASGRLSRE
jgi:hypothetical protein